MTDGNTQIEFNDHPEPAQPNSSDVKRPCFAIMGEFSAGKSTLSNLLIGTPSLPVKVTATQLPPVWISYGDQSPYLVKVDGTEHPFDFNDLSDLSLDDTLCIRVFHKSDALELCDLIDMPGISDPNMSSEVWERALHLADGVIWCTHATQAWRQSEAAVWATVDPALNAKSLLLLTRIDKIMNERDRLRVMRRVEREVDGLFSGVIPISLTEAIEAGDDHERWQKSGAEAFAIAIIDIVEKLAKGNEYAPAVSTAKSAEATETAPVDETSEPQSEETDVSAGSILTMRKPVQTECHAEPRVVPQRIKRATNGPQRQQRPANSGASPTMP